MKCPECGVEVNVQTSRCHSCGALLHKPGEKPQPKYEEIGIATKRSVPFLFLIGYLLLLLIITYPLYVMFENRQKSERLKDNLEVVMDKLKDYAKLNGVFPKDPQTLIDIGLMVAFPENPYHERIMKNRKPGQAFAGDFTYLPLYDERGRAMGCVLVGYGPDLDGGKDVFTEGANYFNLMEFTPEPDGKPDGVIHILHTKRGEYRV
jgi:hypothetical protein